jgi:hypothetical protein
MISELHCLSAFAISARALFFMSALTAPSRIEADLAAVAISLIFIFKFLLTNPF